MIDVKAEAETIIRDVLINKDSWWLGSDEIVDLCDRVRDEERKRCADIADRRMVFHQGHVGDYDSGAFIIAEQIRNQILRPLILVPEGKKEI